MKALKPRLLLSALVVVLLAGAATLLFRLLERSPDRKHEPPAVSESDTGYVDPEICRPCHASLYGSYERTGMGRSFYRLTKEKEIEDWKSNNVFYHRASDRYYTMYERNGRYYQRRHQVGWDGRETNVVEKEVHFVIGSGNRARTYLHRTPDGRLSQLPVAWYSEGGGFWAMNPGYDRPDHHDFRRRITHECMFCHNAYPEIEAGSDGFGRESIYRARIPEGIDCQRCHGPGRGHIQALQARGATVQTIRASIVNPERLSAEKRLELCMQCHLETTSSRLPPYIRRFNRGLFSYRPGEPLAGYILHFDYAPTSGREDRFEIAHQAYRLRMSACFKKSPAMTCTTCHDPHNIPRGAEAVRHYTAVCKRCHEGVLQEPPGSSRHPRSPECLGCHMFKRRTDDVVHAIMTDHHIQRLKPDRNLLAPLSEEKFYGRKYQGEIIRYYPPEEASRQEDPFYLAVAQVTDGANLKDGITRLERAVEKFPSMRAEFYFELGEGYAKDGRLEKGISMYEEALRRDPSLWPARHGLGVALSRLGNYARAAHELERASKMGTEEALSLNDLGLVYRQLGRLNDAIAALQRAVGREFDFPEAHNNLGGMLLERGETAGAEEAFRNALRAQPDFAAARNNLAKLLAARGDLRQAQHHFEWAIRSNPNFAQARYDYGLALAGMDRQEAAEKQLEAAVRLEPGFAEAHSTLGDILAIRGKSEDAIRRYRRALEIEPEHHPAHLGLGMLLLKRDPDEARTHLEKAARSPDGHIRQTALESLAKIRGR